MRRISVLALIVGLATVTAMSLAAQSREQKVNLMLSTMPAGKDPQRYKNYIEPRYKEFEQRSLYLTMRDGVRIAIDPGGTVRKQWGKPF